MNVRFEAARRQSGAALIVLLALLLLVSAAILLDRLSSEANASTRTHKANAKSLAEAKAALIAWSVTLPSTVANQARPGSLPFPDRNTDGNYDGLADCVVGVNDVVLIGRLPRSGEDAVSCGSDIPLNVDLRDGAGEPLWYAVSRNVITRSRTATGGDSVTLDDTLADFVTAGVQVGETIANTTDGSQAVVTNVASATSLDLSALTGGRANQFASGDNYVIGPSGPLNPDSSQAGRMTYPWIHLRDPQGNIINDPKSIILSPLEIAAVIFAPGAVVGNQNRSGSAPAAANYLDSITISTVTYDNADTDGCPDDTPPCTPAGEDFIAYSNPQSGEDFNDQLVYITVDELMRAAEKRVLGDTAVTLKSYYGANGVYPWLTAFRNPRAGLPGTADSGTATNLVEAAGNFVARGVQVGDIIVNTDDGSRGPITAVTATQIDFDALTEGAENDVDAGENFVIEPSFKLTRSGQLPVHLPNGIFNTTFDVVLDIHDVTEDDSASTVPPGDPLIPDDDFIQTSTFTDINGRCMWTGPARVDCKGARVILGPYPRPSDGLPVDKRTIEVSLSFSGNFGFTAPTTSEPRKRNVTTLPAPGPPYLPDPVPVAAPMLPQDDWIIIVTDELAGQKGVMRIDLKSTSDGSIAANNIRYDFSVVYDDVDDAQDEVPEWFVENNWHHFIFAAFSSDVVLGGDDDCANPPPNTCLTLNVEASPPAVIDVRALLVSSGVQWTNQDRDIGDCDGDAVWDDFLCSYFETDNSDKSTAPLADTYARDKFSAGFNDQIRIIE